jgi:hypothetical protein
MSTRVKRMLGRFPAHFVATRPGKGLTTVATALASSLEVLSTDLAGVRLAHRIGHATELTDVLRLAGLHGLSRREMGLLFRRWDALAASISALEEVADGPEAERDSAATALLEIWGLGGVGGGLEIFSPAHDESDPPDLAAAATRLVEAARRTLEYPELVDRVRARVLTTARQHALGNGTVSALLVGAANGLDLDLDLDRNTRAKRAALEGSEPVPFDAVVQDDLFHSKDHFWHATYVRQRGPLVRPVPTLVPEGRVVVGPATTVSELAEQSGTPVSELLSTAAGLGLAVSDPDEVIGRDDGFALADATGLSPELASRGTIRISGTPRTAEIARRLGVTSRELIRRLETVGVPDCEPDTRLTAATIALAARRYGIAVEESLRPGLEVIGLEENPLRRISYEHQDCPHGHRFTVLRKGFGRALLRADVEGLDDLTVGPMLVNLDEGRGFGWFGTVNGGQTLRFQEEGRLFLDGDDVTDRGFSWKGACFADATVRHRKDFVFPGPSAPDDRWARTIETQPPNALDREAVYPHDGHAVEMPGVAVGATRMAFFVQVARLSSREGPEAAPTIRRVTPHIYIGFADQSVFSATEAPDAAVTPYPQFLPPGFPVAARVVISWLEHEAYAARLLVPPRMERLDEDGVSAADRLLAAGSVQPASTYGSTPSTIAGSWEKAVS